MDYYHAYGKRLYSWNNSIIIAGGYTTIAQIKNAFLFDQLGTLLVNDKQLNFSAHEYRLYFIIPLLRAHLLQANKSIYCKC